MKDLMMYHQELKQERERICQKLESLDRRIERARDDFFKDQLRDARVIYELEHQTIFALKYNPNWLKDESPTEELTDGI